MVLHIIIYHYYKKEQQYLPTSDSAWERKYKKLYYYSQGAK